MEIVRTDRYRRDLKRLRASHDDIATLEQTVASNPESGDVVPGLGGIRKIRFRIGKKGKRGGGRAVYFVLMSEDQAVMLSAYSKNTQEDLTTDQKKAILAIMEVLKDGEE